MGGNPVQNSGPNRFVAPAATSGYPAAKVFLQEGERPEEHDPATREGAILR